MYSARTVLLVAYLVVLQAGVALNEAWFHLFASALRRGASGADACVLWLDHTLTATERRVDGPFAHAAPARVPHPPHEKSQCEQER